MKNHCIPYFGGKEITKTKYYMMKYYNKYVSMLFAVLLVSSAWAAEVSDSLKTLNTIGQATTYIYNYPVSKKLRQLEKLVAVGAFDEDVETLRAVL